MWLKMRPYLLLIHGVGIIIGKVVEGRPLPAAHTWGWYNNRKGG